MPGEVRAPDRREYPKTPAGGYSGSDSPAFLQRCSYWHAAMDPALLLASEAEIRNRGLELGVMRDGTEQDQAAARQLAEMSLHPDTGTIIPIFLRPVAYMMFGTPLVMAALMPHRGVMSALTGQLIFQLYNTAFTAAHRNLSVKRSKSWSENRLYLSAIALNMACIGAVDTFVRKTLTAPAGQTFRGRILQAPLFAFMGGFSVLLARISEVEDGIEVQDAAGNTVGVSQKAGKKAVRETALSRAALFGVTALMPSLVRRSAPMIRHPRLLTITRLILVTMTFSTFTPVTFSLFPRRGKIARDKLESDLKEKTAELELFYHRGL